LYCQDHHNSTEWLICYEYSLIFPIAWLAKLRYDLGMLWLRKIIFYIFAIIYLILCPLIVARMLGFVVNPLTHHLVKTGLVYISTNPPDATVYIDGCLSHQKTPQVLRDLTPGKHFIRIEMEGYKDWEQTIPIVGKKATVLANTLLIPEQWPLSTISNQAYQNIFLADDDILIATNPVLKDIGIFHMTQDTGIIPLFSADSIYADGKLLQLYTAPQSPFILLEAMMKDTEKFLWINVNSSPVVIEDISDLFPQTPARIAWNNTDNSNIFAFYKDSTYRINIKDKAIYPQDMQKLPPDLLVGTNVNPEEKFMINDHNDLLVREGRWIRLYPKADFGPPQVYDIAQYRPSTNMYFEEKNGELFYLDNDSRALSAAQILPYHPVLNIPIPDAIRNKMSNKEP